jgi:hypothetical protein
MGPRSSSRCSDVAPRAPPTASPLLHRPPAAPTAHASRQPPGAGASPPSSPPACSPARKEKNARRQLPWGAPWLCRRPLRQRRCEGGRGGPSGRRLGFPPSRPREGDARDESGTLHQLRLTRQLLICSPANRAPAGCFGRKSYIPPMSQAKICVPAECHLNNQEACQVFLA